MAHYFIGRQKIGEPFEAAVSSHRKVLCTIFKRWVEKESYECNCGVPGAFKVTKTWGVSQKESEVIENAVGSSIGVKGVAELKSSIKVTSGHEVQWTYTKAEEMSYTCEPPECGSKDLTIYQLAYEYDLVGYHRGYLFKANVWDRKWARTVVEELASYSSVPDTIEYDERCKNCSPKPSPEYDGRLSVDLGPLSLLVPYKLNKEALDIRVGKFGVRYPVLSYENTVRAVEGGSLTITLQRDHIDPPLLFLSGLEGELVEGRARVYWDQVTGRLNLEQGINLQNYEAVQIIGRTTSIAEERDVQKS